MKNGFPPLSLSGGHWVNSQIDADSFSLAEYLRHLLQASNVSDLPVWYTLHGLMLVPYQAVILQKHWDRFWQLMKPLWGSMRTKYRSLHGGSRAPKLCVVQKATFVQASWNEAHSPKLCENQSPCIPYSVSKTFVNVDSDDDACTVSRSASTPPIWFQIWASCYLLVAQHVLYLNHACWMLSWPSKSNAVVHPVCFSKRVDAHNGIYLVESNDRDLLRLLVNLTFSWAEGFLNCLV